MYWKILFRMILMLAFYTVFGIVLYFLFMIFDRALSETSYILKRLITLIDENSLLIGFLYLVVGYGAIFFYYGRQPFQFIGELLDATEKIYRKDEELIELSEPLKEVEFSMNQLKLRIQSSERAAKEAEQRKNDLITYLAHDLKTPLTSVIGYLSLLDEAPDLPAEQKAKYVHITLEKAKRLEKLINEFFEITRYNMQQILLEEETIDLSYMLVQMSDEFYPLLKAHNNTIQLEAGENLTLYGDPERLARVFNNILKNAIAYSYEGSEIEVEAKREGSEIHLFFRNHGKTIPKQKLDTIFEKFFRLDEARATNTGGAGLGLAIAKEIVSLHGGTITASSEREMTIFKVSLPAAG